MKNFHRIGLWVGLVLIVVAGCGRKTPVALSLYCSVSHLPVTEELAKTFQQVYGVVVVCIPTDDATHPVFTEWENKGPKKKNKNRFEIQRKEILDSEEIRHLKNWIETARYRDFSQYLSDNGDGDLYLCDSLVEVQQLEEFEILQKARPLAYLTPVLLVHPEKGDFRSVEDVIKSPETLGIVRREINGLGRETARFLQKIREKDAVLQGAGKTAVFDNETLLLQAWKENQIAAVICWDSSAARLFPETEPIVLPRTEVLAVPLTMCDLDGGGDHQIMELFSVFAASEKGQNLFRQFGYRVK
ncbi:MAG: substrate-binding domain-containing protein [Planctomycetaceae bacterium]|nr:substrate-binding domain-containing protein [Planctomycetaceae bacterium]